MRNICVRARPCWDRNLRRVFASSEVLSLTRVANAYTNSFPDTQMFRASK